MGGTGKVINYHNIAMQVYTSLIPRPIPSFSMLHTTKQEDSEKLGMGPGDEAKCIQYCYILLTV